MGKLIVFSILGATVIIPLIYARDTRRSTSTKRRLRKTLIAFAVYLTLWVFATIFIAPRL